MSAQNPRPSGVLAAIAGLIGFSAVAGALVTVMVAPALAVTSVAATSTISVFDNLPEFVDVGVQPQQNKIYAISGYKKDGSPKYSQIATVFSQNREEISEEDVTDDLRHAVLAAEDVRFYEHGGVDLQGITRAVIINLSGGDMQGASTLTQQLVKNVCVSNAVKDYPNADQYEQQQAQIVNVCQAPTLDRKLKEMKQAIGLEKTYTKDQILLAYLNIAGFGGNVYGIQSAAKLYYGVPVSQLTVPQIASLLGIVQDPTKRRLDMSANYKANEQRRNYILRKMNENDWLSDADYQAALKTHVSKKTVNITSPKAGCLAANPYAKQFCDYIVRSVKDLESLGSTTDERLANWRVGGYKIYTTLDLAANKIAQDSLRKYAPVREKLFQLGASAVSVEPATGKIRVMAQNKSYNVLNADGTVKPGTSSINFNTDYEYGGSNGFQPGSSWKLFTLLNWLAHGHGLNEVVDVSRAKTPFSDFTDTCNFTNQSNQVYSPRNYSNETGYRTVENATVHSINGGFVQMAVALDMCDMKKIALALGERRAAPQTGSDGVKHDITDLSTNPAAIIGVDNIAPIRIAGAYAAVANGGIYCKPIAVERMVGPDGKALKGQQSDCSQGVPSEVAAAAAVALKAAAARYNGNPHDGTPIIGKTGTTDSANQTWATISSTGLTTTVWFGNISGSHSVNSYGSGGTFGGDQRHQIARAIMSYADRRWPGHDFDKAPQRLITGSNIEVADYTGLTEDDAKSSIEALKFKYDDEGEIASGLPKGTVAKQQPEAGTKLSAGQHIKVWYSDGSQGLMPDIVGNPQDFNTAKASLEALGFTLIGIRCEETPVQSKGGDKPGNGGGNGGDSNLPFDGQIVQQAPSAGRSLPYDSRIILTTAHEHC